ncbi:MAG: hypothetical protein B7Y39_07480 [Bdellovibrio sp. 28-41-41]|nr:MAG: hypothetical protein B7Y39_07480 [Bdellovibrio sp. 28-41-41]
MKDFLCPQCGAGLKFTTAYAVSTVCEFCNSLVVRHDLNLELLGKEAILQDDLNPLQVGTRGVFKKTGFSIKGGVRLNHHEGFWQEWFLELDSPTRDSRYAWLAQAQGEYQFLFEPVELPRQSASEFQVGATVAVPSEVEKLLGKWSSSLVKNADAFKAIDIRTAQMTHFLGQLPWAPDKNRQRTVAELSSTDDAKMTIEFGSDKTLLYYGQVLDFEDFKFQNLKEVKGW